MALAPLVTRDAQTPVPPSSPAQSRVVKEFSTAAKQARADEAASSKGADGQNAVFNPSQHRVQGRGDGKKDQNQGDQHHHLVVTVRYTADGQKIVTSDGHVTRTKIGGDDANGLETSSLPGTGRRQDSGQSVGAETLRNPAPLSPGATNVALSMPRNVDVRSPRHSDTAAKGAAEGGTASTSVLNAEAAIHNQQSGGGSPGGGSQQGQGGDTTGGNDSNDNAGGGDQNTGGIGGGGRGTIRPTATGANPEEPDDDAARRARLTAEWRPDHLGISRELRADITSRFVELELSQPDYNFDYPRFYFRAELLALAKFLVTTNQLNLGSKRVSIGQLSLDEAIELIKSLLEAKRNTPGRDEIVQYSSQFIRIHIYKGVTEEANADYREAFALASRHDIRQSLTELFLQMGETEEYKTLNLNFMRSPARDAVMDYLISSSDSLEQKIAVAIDMMPPRYVELWQAVAAPFTLTSEQNDAISELLLGLEVSHWQDYDFNTETVPFRFFLKTLAAFLMGQGQGMRLSLDETSYQLDALLNSKSGLPECEAIICNSASFIMAFPYKAHSARPDKAIEDYGETINLAIRHDIREPLVDEFSQLYRLRDFAELDVDLLAAPEFESVMAYFVSSSDSPNRKAAIAVVMLTTGLTLDEARRNYEMGLRAERARSWAEATPGNTQLYAFNQALDLEDDFRDLMGNDFSLLDMFAAPLRAFDSQGFAAEQSVNCLERVLRNSHGEPIEQFRESTRPMSDQLEWRRNARNSLAQFPVDFMTRMANDGISPQICADHIVGATSGSLSVPVMQKNTVSILQATSGTLTPAKLQQLVPYLNGSRLAPTLLIAIAQSFLENETPLAELQQQAIANIGTMTTDQQHTITIENRLIDIVNTETALLNSQTLGGIEEAYLDMETGDTKLILTVSEHLGRMGLASWSSARSCIVKLVLNSEVNEYAEFSSKQSFNVQFPGQLRRQDADSAGADNYFCRRLPPGTVVSMDFTDSNGAERNLVFRLPQIRGRTEGLQA